MNHGAEAPPQAGLRRRRVSRVALRITLFYVVGAAIWIVASDWILGALVRDPALVTALSILKGWTFVAATGLLLYVLVSRGVRPIADSAEEYRGLFDGHPSIYLKVDANGTILSVNPLGSEQLGYAVSELTGRSVLHLYADSDRQIALERIGALGSGAAEVARWEAQATRKDGTRIWLRQSARAVQAAGGGRAILLVGEDITERRSSEAALGAAHENLRTLFHASPLAIIALDRAGRVLSWNPAAEAIFGWSEPEVLGRPLPVLSDDRQAEFLAQLDRAIEGEVLSQVEFRHRLKSGSLVDVSLSAAPLRDASGRKVGTIAVIDDITRRKAADRELARLNRALRVLIECGQAVMRAATEDELLRSVCSILVEVGGYRLAWVGYAENDDARTVRPVAHFGFEDGYLDTVRISWADDEWGRGPTGTAIRSGKPAAARNLETEPSYGPWRAEAGRRHFASSIGLPLGLTGSPFGALSIYAAEPDAFDEEEVRLLGELASDVAFGVESLRIRAEQHRAEEGLRQRTAELQAIFRAFPDLYFRLDGADRILDHHAGRAADLYVPPEQFLGKKMQDVLPPDVAAAFEEAIVAARATGFAATEYALSLPEGEKWFEARLVKMVEDQTLVIVRDVTERRRAAEAIRRSAERLEHLQEIDRAILAARSADEVARASLARIRQLVPCDRAAVVVRDRETGACRAIAVDAATGAFVEEDALPAGEFIASLEEAREEPCRYFDDLSAVTERSPFVERASAAGMRTALLVPFTASGELIGGLGLASGRPSDFETEHLEIAAEIAGQMAIALHQEGLREELRRRAVELEQRVDERTAELSAANEELETFSYSVTHDLRAPLRAMEGFARALVEDQAEKLGEEGRRYAERIMAAALRLDRIVQDLLRYSRLRRAEIRLKPVSLESVIEEVVASRETAIASAGAEIAIESPLPDVIAHRPTLVQIAENLLDNALKFVARGTKPKVCIRAESAHGTVRLSVEDNGIGIAAEDRERIFKVFERLHGVETYPGSGIGLAIVRKAAERMGGRCDVEAGPDGGSRFWVEIASHSGAPAPAGGPPSREEGGAEP